jgi:hypothetical protein
MMYEFAQCVLLADSFVQNSGIIMGTSHLILGETADYITGQVIPDTHDERIRQVIAKLLVEVKGFHKNDILARQTLALTVDQKTGFVHVDYTIKMDDKISMIIIYAPGSLVTRQRPTLSTARLLEDYVIPFAVITNGKDATTMDAKSGKVIGEGLESIPDRQQLQEKMKYITLHQISGDQREKEQRILFAMEVLTRQECSDYTCSL